MRFVPMERKWPAALGLGVFLLILLLTGHAGLYLETQAPATDGAIRRGDPSRQALALMFNVDWGEEFIDQILDRLEGAYAKSTFFVTGRWAEKNPDLLREIHARGHEVGNHGYRHAHVASLSSQEIRGLIEKNRDLLRGLLEVEPVPLFAPPYGECNVTIVKAAQEIGYKTILWSLDTVDWRRPAASTIVETLTRAGPGDLVLMHPTAPTLDALGPILRDLASRGLTAVSVSDLLADKEQ